MHNKEQRNQYFRKAVEMTKASEEARKLAYAFVEVDEAHKCAIDLGHHILDNGLMDYIPEARELQDVYNKVRRNETLKYHADKGSARAQRVLKQKQGELETKIYKPKELPARKPEFSNIAADMHLY